MKKILSILIIMVVVSASIFAVVPTFTLSAVPYDLIVVKNDTVDEHTQYGFGAQGSVDVVVCKFVNLGAEVTATTDRLKVDGAAENANTMESALKVGLVFTPDVGKFGGGIDGKVGFVITGAHNDTNMSVAFGGDVYGLFHASNRTFVRAGLDCLYAPTQFQYDGRANAVTLRPTVGVMFKF